MQLRLGGAHVGALLHQLRRQAHRNVSGQLEGIQFQHHGAGFGRCAPQVNGQLRFDARQRLPQGRQLRLRCRQLRLERQQVTLGTAAEAHLFLRHVDLLGEGRHDLLGGLDLRAQRGFLHRRRDHVRNQAEIGAFQLKALCLDLGGLVFERATCGAEQVHGPGHVHRGVVERERRPRGRGRSDCGRIGALTRDASARIDGRQHAAARGIEALFALAQGGLRRGHGRTVGQCPLHAAIQFRIVETRPPLRRHIGVSEKPLRIATGHRSAGGGRRYGASRDALDGRRIRRLEIRADRGTTSQRRRNRQRHERLARDTARRKRTAGRNENAD